ncbi:MAG TPA: sigma-70 family RNA polymerase sigma factor [Bryobacteraceae bacterium]
MAQQPIDRDDGVGGGADNLTVLLKSWASGDQDALARLMPLAYDELHRIAQQRWRGQQPGHTLQPTVLIHEAYLKLISQGQRTFENRLHFFAVMSMAMRQVLVNHAEASLAAKRGGGKVNVPLDEANTAALREAKEVLDLHEALKLLAQVNPRQSRIVELRYFGGLSIEEAAEALSISAVTVTRDWHMARAWLARELGASSPGPA